MKKQVLSILAALALCLMLLPTAALAETAGTTGQESHTHYLCGGDSCTEKGHTCTDKITFTEWTSDSSLPSEGSWYLTKDVTLSTGNEVTGELTLDLNGYSIICNSDQSAIYVMSDGCFTLTDCNGSGSEHRFAESGDGSHRWVLDESGPITVNGGVITHGSANIGWGVAVNDGSTFNMYGGTVCGNRVASNYGAGVDVYKGTFTMYGGAIKGNVATYGGGVFVNDNCAFTMYGGEIDGNSAVRSGGGVNVSRNGAFTMAGGAITDNAVTGNTNNVKVEGGGGVHVDGGTFTMSGDAKITDNTVTDTATTSTAKGGGVFVGDGGTLRLSDAVEIKDNEINGTDSNIYLPDNTAIEITGNLTGGASAVGVTLENMTASGYTVFAKAASGVTLTDADKNVFFIDNDDGTCRLTRGGSELLITYGEQHIHPICGDTCTHRRADGSYEHPNVTWTGTATLPDTAGYWYLTQNVEGGDTWTPVDGTFLDLNGYNVTMTGEDKAVIAVSSGAFTLCDCRKGGTAANGKIAHSTKPNSGSDTSGAGCGVSLLNASDAQFTMYGGEISGNWIGVTAKDSGGFELYGGSITGNTKNGVWQMRCRFDMYDGSITKNGSTDNGNGGSGVYVTETTFAMHGGTISGNTSGRRGGGVCVNRGTFEMSGGEITQNTSTGDGYGGVYVMDAFTVSGDAKVTGNTGKNVYLGNDVRGQQIRIIVSGELSDSAHISVSAQNTPTDDAPVTIATAATSGWIKAGNFISDDSFYRVITADDGKTATLEVHEHQWEVLKDSENVLKEHCTVANCTTAAGGTLTLTASDKDYDAAPGEAVITAPDWHSSTENYVIAYEQKNDDGSFTSISGAPTAWGSYRAGVTVDGVTAMQEFQIKPYTLYSGDFTFRAPSDLTYNGQPKTAAVTAKDAIAGAIGAVTVKYYDADGHAVAEPTNVGTYTVKIDVARGEGYCAETGMFDQSWTFTIQRADSTGEPNYTKITTAGKTLADAKLTTVDSTLRPAVGALEWIDDESNVLPDSTGVEANKTYRWRFTPTDANYETLTGEIELYHVTYGGGGSSAPAYPVSTPDKTENGSVTVSPRNASKGTTVTVTVTPDSGYVLETISVIDKTGNDLKLTDKGNGKYTFTMPGSKVEIKVTFMEDNSVLNFFYDVPNDAYYYEAVKWAAENGITGGVGNSLFAPNQPCTRAQIVTFLWRAAGSPVVNYLMPFTDVDEGAYYAEAVRWAASTGIVTGLTEMTFGTNDVCTRAQAAAMIYRYAQAQGKGFTGAWMFLLPFTDVPEWAYESVAWCYMNGVTTGVKETAFAPGNDCTRAQIVTFLWRASSK